MLAGMTVVQVAALRTLDPAGAIRQQRRGHRQRARAEDDQRFEYTFDVHQFFLLTMVK
jgi:hypothetical protein